MDELDYNKEWDFEWADGCWNDIDDDVKDLIIDKDIVAIGIPKDNIVRFPISTDEKNMKNKSFDYKLLAILTLFSKHTPGEDHRYITKDDIILNEEKIQELSKKKTNTIIKNVRKLSRMQGNTVIAKIINGKIIYIINYKNEDGRKYVLIEEKLLRYLADTSSSNLIKVYLLLKYRCNEETETKVTRQSLADGIGLCGNSGDSKMTITNILNDLTDKHLIEKSNRYINIELENGNFKNTECIMIKLKTYEAWLEHQNKK